MENYSVLMSVYYKENPKYLKESLDSIFAQTHKTNDFVLVCDGELSKELWDVIDDAQNSHKDVLHLIKLKENVGLGMALNEGLKHCKNLLVARMDSDDISLSTRCEKQVRYFEKNPSISILSGYVEEFSSNYTNIRKVPKSNSKIITYSKSRNPFNHPCVMYKKDDVEQSGGYIDFYLLEDYFLWIRMLQKGFKGNNLQEVLLLMRGGEDLHKRRGGVKYANSQLRLFKYMYKSKYISFFEYVYSGYIRYFVSISPNNFRALIYKYLLRKPY